MMTAAQGTLFAVGLALIGLVPLMGIVAIWKAVERRYSRESPLTRDLLRPPGHSLQCAIEDLNRDIEEIFMALVLIPVFVFLTHVCQSYFFAEPESRSRIVSSVIAGVVLVALASWRFLVLYRRRRHFVLGLDGERATAEELNQLMLDGCRVFHDVPITYGNIDHVVVHQSGVYLVNSKLLGKQKSIPGGSEVTVDNERAVIRFPDRRVPIPVKRFETEERWLSEHLSKSTGQSIKVEAMLALPGWFVKERIGKGPVYVFNPKNPQKFFVHQRRALSPQVVQQVAHQLEQLCRDVKPSFRKERVRWEYQN